MNITNKKYMIRFWFDYGGICLWSVNKMACDRYGYAIESDKLPISAELLENLNELEDEYHSYLDWNYPPSPSPWTKELKQDFIDRATDIYNVLCRELGNQYEVINDVGDCCK